MSVRFILRPKKFLTTPLALKEALNARLSISIPLSRTRSLRGVDWNKDFFIGYPSSQSCRIENQPSCYDEIQRLFSSTKPTQRKFLSRFFNTPRSYFRGAWCGGSVRRSSDATSSEDRNQSSSGNEVHEYNGREFIIRPTSHYGGEGWESLGAPSQAGIERLCTGTDYYVQEVFPKKWEYRIVFSMGEVLFTLIKRNTSSLPINLPWNHTQGTYFTTVHTWSNNRLRRTSVFEDFAECTVLKNMHFGALDIMLDADYNYSVCEMNFAPALTIRNNLEKVVRHVETARSGAHT